MTNKYNKTLNWLKPHYIVLIFVIVCCAIVGLHFLVSSLAATVTTNTQSLSVPIHFDDTWWNWPANASGYTNYTIDITPEADGSPDGYFFSSFFIFYNGGAVYNGTGVGYGYLGLQTEEAGGFTGKNTIFSIWGSTAASGGQYTTRFTEGTSGWSVRNSYQWVVGHTYALTVSYLSTDASGEHWNATVTDTITNVTSNIGQLIIPVSFGMLTNSTGSFHERYSGSIASCNNLQVSDVEFTNPLFNGSIVSTGHTNYQPNVTPCSNYGTVDITGGYRSVIGGLPPQTTPTPVTATPPPTVIHSTVPSTTSKPAPPTASTSITTPVRPTPVNKTTAEPVKVSDLPTPKVVKHMSIARKIVYGMGIGVGAMIIASVVFVMSRVFRKHRRISTAQLDYDLHNPARPPDETKYH